jgi:hypothetical protein
MLKLSEDMVLRRIFGYTAHKKLYVLGNIIVVFKSWTVRWDGYVARVGGVRDAYKTLLGNL